MIRAGILGVRGYMGGEVLRVLLNHPEVDIDWLAGRRAGKLSEHPHLHHLDLDVIDQEQMSACDVVFMATPTEASLQLAPRIIDMGARLIDLGATFRINNQSTWETIYQMEHTAWTLQQNSVYGINELYLENIKTAQIIANPGCFSSSIILALAPLVEAKLIDNQAWVTGLSGSSGMGRDPNLISQYNELANNLVAYNVVDHRHSYEVEQELSRLQAGKFKLHFTPVYVPIKRGILSICHCEPIVSISRAELLELYRSFYQHQPFVNIINRDYEQKVSWQYQPYPWVSHVAASNFSMIGLDYDETRGRIVILSALDNLGKGGAQVAIENMNIMFDLPRTLGLNSHAACP